LIGEGAGIGPTLFLAEQMRANDAVPDATTAGTGRIAVPDTSVAKAGPIAVPPGVASPARCSPLVLLGSNTPFPFRPRPSVIVVPGIPTGIIACMPLLEEWGIASRLANTADLPGCFEGLVTDLADAWLSSLSPIDLSEVEILSCGPTPMLEATATLARRHNVPYQTSSPDAQTTRD
jgi:dihydroorotate dehydrogenase electron transfer subunit